MSVAFELAAFAALLPHFERDTFASFANAADWATAVRFARDQRAAAAAAGGTRLRSNLGRTFTR